MKTTWAQKAWTIFLVKNLTMLEIDQNYNLHKKDVRLLFLEKNLTTFVYDNQNMLE